eukprot:scaffold109253_cov72-Phaeocystis_antarctica.AAC.4
MCLGHTSETVQCQRREILYKAVVFRRVSVTRHRSGFGSKSRYLINMPQQRGLTPCTLRSTNSSTRPKVRVLGRNSVAVYQPTSPPMTTSPPRTAP